MSRRARWLVALALVSLVFHLVPVIAFGGVAGTLCFGVLALLEVQALGTLLVDYPRPRWQVRFWLLPLLTLWAAAGLATTLALPLALLAAFTALSLATGCALASALGLALACWGAFVRRRRVRIRRVPVPIPGLPAAFDGYRVVQLSDLHVGSFDDEARARAWAARANALGGDLVVVTGDLVTSGTGFYAAAARALAELRAPDGVVVTMGNHDQWDNTALLRELEGAGLEVLRNTWRFVERGDARIVLAAVDDRYSGRADLERSLHGRPAGAVTLLLSHFPEYFEEARAAGVALTLSGHTHGGQIAVPFLARWLNIARLFGMRSAGLFVEQGAALYVNAGLGTTGPPIRLGVPPELAIIELVRA